MSELSSPEAPAARPAQQGWWAGWPGRILRLTFALLPLFWLSRKIGFRDVLARAREVGAVSLLGAFTAIALSICVASIRWKVLMRAYGATETPSFLTTTRHFLVGGYFAVLPSGIAGDAVRGVRMRKFLPDLATSYVVLFVERLSGLMGLCLIAATAAMLSPARDTSLVTQILNLVFICGVAAAAGVLLVPFVVRRHAGLRKFLSSIPVAGRIVLSIPPATTPWRLLVALALSVPTQSGVILAVAAMMSKLWPSITLLTCARVVPAVTLVTYVPLTPGGMGQREAAFKTLFGFAGVPDDISVATSLLLFGVLMSFSLLGGLCVAWERAARIED